MSASAPPEGAMLLSFPPRPRRLRADVPPFDPTNPAHIAAWESVIDMGRVLIERERAQ